MFCSTKFFRTVSVAVLLTAASVISAAPPTAIRAPVANTTSPNTVSDAPAEFPEGIYEITFSFHNVLRSVLGNSLDVVAALPDVITPAPIWDIKRGENGFFTLSVGEENAGTAREDRNIPLGKESGSWDITKPFDRPAQPDEWIITSPVQLAIFPPLESGWKVAEDTASGPLTVRNRATVFTFVRVGN